MGADDINRGAKNKNLDAVDATQKNIHDKEELDMETRKLFDELKQLKYEEGTLRKNTNKMIDEQKWINVEINELVN